MGGGVFELGNPERRGAQAVLEIQVGGGLKQFWKSRWEGGSKNRDFRRGGVDFFWNNPMGSNDNRLIKLLKYYPMLWKTTEGSGNDQGRTSVCRIVCFGNHPHLKSQMAGP